MPGILPLEDRELTKLLETSLKKQGIEILTSTKVDVVKPGANEVRVTVSGQEGAKELNAERALMAIGVQGNVENLGLEALGVMKIASMFCDRFGVDLKLTIEAEG